mmetsp:Transcript_21100/g.66663  ORF Transcript_21100/g.66663 Transcript_21100/m.66663 type:complete len:298 (-) Transcript_21100:62-955(-)
MAGDDGEAQRIIDEFVQGMVAGRDIRTIGAGGHLSTAHVQLDKDVTTLTVQRAGLGPRAWPLESISSICIGDEASGGDDHLDELCVTLCTEEGDSASFRFGDMEERDTFALCLGMFVDGLRNAQGDEGEQGGWGEYDGGYQEDVASAISAAQQPPSSVGSSGGDPGELTEAQRLVKGFVQEMVRGRNLEMLSSHGGSVECLVTLDRDLTEMIIQRSQSPAAKKRTVPLRNIEHIAVGTEAEEDVELPVDDLCVALLLKEGKVLAFRFGDVEDRDTFALCLGIFVDGNRKKGKRRLRL